MITPLATLSGRETHDLPPACVSDDAVQGVLEMFKLLSDETRLWGEQDMAKRAKAVLTWRPPFLRGAALRNWAASTAKQVASDRLAGKRSAETPVQLAEELEAAAEHAMLPLARSAELERVVPCPESGQGIVGVTAPEALSIAAYLRKNSSRAEQKQIYELAVANSKKLALSTQRSSNPAAVRCPLLGEDHVCCVYAARPLRCRPLHAMSVAQSMGSRAAEFADMASEPPDQEGHERTVQHGIEIGLTSALATAGLDANVYELNSALAVALAAPDTAERWANGENVFERCHVHA
jgi:Fe-S-cluster containining protein